MSFIRNLSKIVSAPVQIIDKTILEPLADMADAAAEGFGAKGDDTDPSDA